MLGAALAGPRVFAPRPKGIPGAILGASATLGHRLRTGDLPPPSEELRTGIVIVGGGMAGLSAAWKLKSVGYPDFTLLELEPEVGGNSRSGENAITPYPWGAHYVPLPGPDATLVRELFEELGVIEGYDSAGEPLYNELYLCSDPQDRLHLHGRWQEGLVPDLGVEEADRRQYASFFKAMADFGAAKGSDGRPAFCIPVDMSSRDPRFTALDQLTMAEYMDQNGWTSKPLRWYVDYGCRDDYGCRLEETSAWAGIHYFASRVGGDPHHEGNVLTWPEGNGWIVAQLSQRLAPQIRANALVFNVETSASGEVRVDFYDPETRKSTRIVAEAAILAAPRFVAARLVDALRSQPPSYLKAFEYSPWMVANLSLDALPAGPGAPLSWDNVPYQSPSLGYIVATHQNVEQYPRRSTVITYYLPLCESAPAEARKAAYARTHGEWSRMIVADLSRMHPGIAETIKRLDVWLWGHAMIRPKPGYIWGPERQEALKPLGRVFFAHSDMSGISIFEEAQYRGVTAAEAAIASLSRS
ncbi:protoporphyrinogen oxidase [compost metagenome]